MFNFLIKKPSKLSDSTLWQIKCYEFLIKKFGTENFKCTILARPISDDFPTGGFTGHELALHYLKIIKNFCGMNFWNVVLLEEDNGSNINEKLTNLGIPYSKSGKETAGTFQIIESSNGYEALITYSKDIINKPVDYIATMSHELSHYLLSDVVDELPGGKKLHEFATDVTSVYLGFGIFQIRSAFRFERYNDGQMTGHSVQRQGYLSRPKFVMSLAIYMELKNLPVRGIQEYLDDDCNHLLNKAIKLLKNSSALDVCKSLIKCK